MTTKTESKGRVIAIGLLLIAAGLILNLKFLAAFTNDGHIGSMKAKAAVLLLQLLLILLGVCLIRFRHRIRAKALGVKLFSWAAFGVFWTFVASLMLFGFFELFPSRVPAALRNNYYYFLKNRYVYDAEFGYRGRPGFTYKLTYFGDQYLPALRAEVEPVRLNITHDENGFHNPEVVESPDIVVLGDSWTWVGNGWEDTLAAKLEASTGRPVYNLGMNGYGPQQYVLAFKHYGAAGKPKVALLCFFEGNDIGELWNFKSWKETGRSSGILRFVSIVETGGFFDRYALLLKLSKAHRARARARPEIVELELGGRTLPTMFGFRSDPRTSADLLELPEWQELERVLVDFKEQSVAAGTVPLLVFFPTKQHIYARYATSNSDQSWLDVREEQMATQGGREEAVASLAEKVGIGLISLTPAFEAEAEEGAFMYYSFDSHWNSTAREVAARVIASEIPKHVDAEEDAE